MSVSGMRDWYLVSFSVGGHHVVFNVKTFLWVFGFSFLSDVFLRCFPAFIIVVSA